MNVKYIIFSFLILLNACIGDGIKNKNSYNEDVNNLSIGWASVSITPDKPVFLRGQHYARVSEGVMDSIKATALAIESGEGEDSQKIIMISCDLVSIPDDIRSGSKDNLKDDVREILSETLPEINSECVFLNATHTHAATYIRPYSDLKGIYGVELEAATPADCQKFTAERIAEAAKAAWENRKPGGISYGLGQAVVGHNRIQTDLEGKSVMYGNTDRPEFSHIEGYEDHSVNLLYTWDKDSELTGVVINIACPSQVSEHSYLISSDFWHDTRVELNKRMEKDVFILPQCSAAGDQSPRVLVGARAEERMQYLMGADSSQLGNKSMGQRKQIAVRIVDAVTSVLPYVEEQIIWDPLINYLSEKVELSRRLISMEEVNEAQSYSEKWKKEYEMLLEEIENTPGSKEKPEWSKDVTIAYSRSRKGKSVKSRYELEKRQPKLTVELNVLRIDDIVMATNPFELYLDYGMRIKAQSPAVQTFLVQLAGDGTYVPTSRSIKGGAYGAVPSSTLIGSEGGQELVEKTLELINKVWE